MSPVEIALSVACVVLLVVCVGAVATMRRLVARAAAMDTTLDRLREEVEELSRRESAREAAEADTTRASQEAADWVITFDGQDPPQTVSTQHVVSTTLGEPLIKMAALSHGVRQALREERRAHLAYQVRREYRRRRRASRSRARAAR
jgi:hypothetical protein